jgi:hypothetical protein
MPDSVTFDGTVDFYRYTMGSLAGTGAISAVAIILPTDFANYNWVITRNFGAAGGMPLGYNTAGQLKYYTGTTDGDDEVSGPTIPSGFEWYLIGVTKAAGTVTPDFHMYRYSTDTWTHQAATGPVANYSAWSNCSFAESSGEFFQGNGLIFGVWDVELTQGDVEALVTGLGAWKTAAPDLGVRFDAISAPDIFSGTSTLATSNTGTLDTGEAPAGWSDADFARPDSDVSDGSWLNEAGSNTNLYDSLNEAIATETDYIESSLDPSSDTAEVGLSNITP